MTRLPGAVGVVKGRIPHSGLWRRRFAVVKWSIACSSEGWHLVRFTVESYQGLEEVLSRRPQRPPAGLKRNVVWHVVLQSEAYRMCLVCSFGVRTESSGLPPRRSWRAPYLQVNSVLGLRQTDPGTLRAWRPRMPLSLTGSLDIVIGFIGYSRAVMDPPLQQALSSHAAPG
nr:hypothetical protein CFP56_13330 [Quercus suber]